jgi:hypothetical protein
MKGRHLALLADKLYTVKKVRHFPVPSWDVINQTIIESVVIKKRRSAPVQFDTGYEPLLKRVGAYMFTKEGTRVPSLNTGGLVYIR